jgi:hypothetical protein
MEEMMKRFTRLLPLAAVAGLASIPLTHQLEAAKEEKVLICHLSEEVDEETGEEVTVGKVISINGNALEAHLAHGDCLAEEGAVKGDECDCAVEEPEPEPAPAG